MSLVLTRRLHERLVMVRRNPDGTLQFDSMATLAITDISGRQVKISFVAPDDTRIFREEIFKRLFPEEALTLPEPFNEPR